MTLEFSRQIFEEHSNIKFLENPSSGSPVIPCGRKDGQTNMTMLIHNKSNKMQQCIKFVLVHIYIKLNMFRATHRPSSGA